LSQARSTRVLPRYLALLEIKIAVAMVLGSFDVRSVASRGAPNGQEGRELMGFVMSPVGLQMQLRPRSKPPV
jgi:hypothetical protein